MGFSRPTRATLVNRAAQDIEGELQNGAALLRRTLERALAVAMGGLAHGMHGHIEWAARQLIPDEADDDFVVRWAEIFMGDGARKPATKAELTILVTAVAGGGDIDEGTQWARADGVTYESTTTLTLPASAPYELLVPVRALEAGDAANAIPGTVLELVNPIADVEAEATVQGDGVQPIGGGTDLERIEDLLARLLEHLQTPPRAGGPGDYVVWAKQVSWVTRAWELPRQLGPSTVLVLAVQDTFDDDDVYEATLLPDAAQVAELQAYLDDRANVTAVITAQAPVEHALDPAVQISPYTAEVEAAVTLQLEALLLRQTGPSVGGWTLRRNDLIQAIKLAAGLDYFVLLTPAVDLELEATEFVTLGTPVYTEAT